MSGTCRDIYIYTLYIWRVPRQAWLVYSALLCQSINPSINRLHISSMVMGVCPRRACILFLYESPSWADCAAVCRPGKLMRTICVLFGALWLSWGGMAASTSIWGVLACSVLRSCGLAVIWVYSTLLLQLVVPNALLGRMMALDLAFDMVSWQPCAGFDKI